MPPVPAKAIELSFRAFPFLEFPPEDFSGGGLRQRIDELHDARHLEGRHAPARPFDDLLCLEIRPAPANDGLHRLASIAVGRADDAGLLNAVVRIEHRLDFSR